MTMANKNYLDKIGLARVWEIIKTKLDGKAEKNHSHVKADISDFPSSMKNPKALTFTGAVTGSYDGSAAKSVAIPTVPTSLKNPNALTVQFNGTTNKTYDGSSAQTVNVTPAAIGAATSGHTHSAMSGATSSAAGTAGMVPAPAAGKQGQYLRGDGTWATPTNTTYSAATTSAAGLMSASDKSKLDGIASGANKITVDSSLSSTSTNPVQNKAVYTALNGKAASDHTHSAMSGATSSAAGTAGMVPAPAAGNQSKYLRGDGTWATPTNTTYSAATTSAAGLMSASDKSKLDGITSGADSVSFSRSLTSGTKVGTITINGTGTDLYAPTNTDTTYSAATTSEAGLMSAADKSKLDGITASADSVSVSRSLTSGTKVGTITINGTGTDLYAPTNTDTHHTAKNIVGSSATATANVTAATSNPYLNLVENGAVRSTHRISGSGATSVKTDTSGNITISSTNTTYSAATTSAAGLMSAADKTKLDGIATGANKITVDSALSSTSTNPVQNKAIHTALGEKADASHSHVKADISDFPTALKNPSSLTIKANGATYKTYNGASAVTADITAALIGAAEDGHTHGTADIDGLTAALNAKAAASHTHAISDVTNLQSTLDGKAAASHTHRKQATNVSVATTAWVSSSTYGNYPFQATVPLSGATSAMIPEVVFGLTEAESGNYAPIASSTSGGVIIYAKAKPSAAITLAAVICRE